MTDKNQFECFSYRINNLGLADIYLDDQNEYQDLNYGEK